MDSATQCLLVTLGGGEGGETLHLLRIGRRYPYDKKTAWISCLTPVYITARITNSFTYNPCHKKEDHINNKGVAHFNTTEALSLQKY